MGKFDAILHKLRKLTAFICTREVLKRPLIYVLTYVAAPYKRHHITSLIFLYSAVPHAFYSHSKPPLIRKI